jgi:acetyl esterase/lipase
VRKNRIGGFGFSAGAGPAGVAAHRHGQRALPGDHDEEFEAALRANGVNVEAEHYDGGTHVVTLAPQPEDIVDTANARLVEFFEKRLR